MHQNGRKESSDGRGKPNVDYEDGESAKSGDFPQPQATALSAGRGGIGGVQGETAAMEGEEHSIILPRNWAEALRESPSEPVRIMCTCCWSLWKNNSRNIEC